MTVGRSGAHSIHNFLPSSQHEITLSRVLKRSVPKSTSTERRFRQSSLRTRLVYSDESREVGTDRERYRTTPVVSNSHGVTEQQRQIHSLKHSSGEILGKDEGLKSHTEIECTHRHTAVKNIQDLGGRGSYPANNGIKSFLKDFEESKKGKSKY